MEQNAASIVVTVYQDNNNQIYPGGISKAITAASMAIEMEQVSLVDKGVAQHIAISDFGTKLLLKISVPLVGYMWVDSTIAAFDVLKQLAGGGSSGGTTTQLKSYLLGTDITISGNSITTADLYGATILAIIYAGTTLDTMMKDLPTPLTQGVGVATLNFTPYVTLTNGVLLEIIFNKN